MNSKIYIDREGIVKYISDCPIEPRYPSANAELLMGARAWSKHEGKVKLYNEALSKAKQDAVRFADQRLIKAFVIEDINVRENRKAFDLFINSSFKPDTLYDLPSGIEVKVLTHKKSAEESYQLAYFASEFKAPIKRQNKSIYKAAEDWVKSESVSITVDELREAGVIPPKQKESQEELLQRYSEFLEKKGYLDSDWRDEHPTAIQRFFATLTKE